MFKEQVVLGLTEEGWREIDSAANRFKEVVAPGILTPGKVLASPGVYVLICDLHQLLSYKLLVKNFQS